jgi:tetratricopeptide (TPR) repeat protein
MDIVLTSEGKLPEASGHIEPSHQELLSSRILQISSWMMVLGTIRLICAIGDYGTALLEMSRFRIPSLRLLGRFAQEYPPALVLGFSWPLVLGLILRRTNSHRFLRAAAITFFILSFGGLLNLVAGAFFPTDSQVLIGSFAVPRGALGRLQLAAVARATIGLAQLALELMTAISAWTLAHSSLVATIDQGTAAVSVRQRLYSRLAVYVALAFLVLNVRHSIWSAYIEVLNESSLVREFVLRTDTRAHVPYRGLMGSPQSPRRTPQLEATVGSALRYVEAKRWQEAKQAYLQVIARAESMSSDFSDEAERNGELARALNNLAWLLVTCEDASFQSPHEALPYAKKAVKLEPEEGMYWNTAGVAEYRVQNYEPARRALERSMELRGNGQGDAYDWFFLAMIQARLGHTDVGRQWYERGVAWYQQVRAGDPELYRFQVEAAELLGIAKPSPPPVMGRGYPDEPGLTGKRIRRPPMMPKQFDGQG